MITTTQGTSFQLEMLQDAIDYHQNGDADDAPCCTATAPCDTRKWVVGRMAELGGSDLVPVIADQAETPRTSGGGQQASTGRRVTDPASDKQISFISRLVGERNVTGLTTYPARTLAQIQAGQEVSKARAKSLIDNLLRAPRLEIQTPAAGPAASEAQMGFLRTLAQENGEEVRTSYTKAEASAEITRLLKLRESGAVRTPARTSGRVTEDGMYRKGDVIYKVQVAKNGSGRLYAKVLREVSPGEWEFAYESGAIAKLTPADRVTVEQAQEFGRLYGVCCRCAADLTDEKSIADGIGPICKTKI